MSNNSWDRTAVGSEQMIREQKTCHCRNVDDTENDRDTTQESINDDVRRFKVILFNFQKNIFNPDVIKKRIRLEAHSLIVRPGFSFTTQLIVISLLPIMPELKALRSLIYEIISHS